MSDSWKQRGGLKLASPVKITAKDGRKFSSEQEEKEFREGLIRLDLFDTKGRILHSHKAYDNTLSKTENHAKFRGVDLASLNYDRLVTMHFNNEKFISKIKLVMILDINPVVAEDIENTICDMGHVAESYVDLELAHNMFIAKKAKWDLILSDAQLVVPTYKNILRYIISNVLAFKPSQKITLMTDLSNFKDKPILDKIKERFNVEVIQKGKNTLVTSLKEVA